MKLYHGGPRLIIDPQLPELGSTRQGHDNGILGIWCAVEKSLAERFAKGGHVTEFGIEPETLAAAIGIDSLSALSKARATEQDYLTFRDNVRQETGCKLISIVEIDGTVGQYIIIDTSCIEYCADPI